MQSGEAGSDQLPLWEGLQPHLEDIKYSVTWSLYWEPGSRIVLGSWMHPPSQGRWPQFQTPDWVCEDSLFPPVAFICCLMVVSLSCLRLDWGGLGKWAFYPLGAPPGTRDDVKATAHNSSVEV